MLMKVMHRAITVPYRAIHRGVIHGGYTADDWQLQRSVLRVHDLGRRITTYLPTYVTNKETNERTNQSTNQSINQSTNQPTNHTVTDSRVQRR